MGYDKTYKEHIKERLIELKEENQSIDLLVITHIDEDHIEGSIEFFKENGHANNPNIIEVKEVWHNSYRHLQFENSKTKEQLVSASNCTQEEDTVSTKGIEGTTLAGYLYGLGYVDEIWNKSYDKKAINIDYKSEIEIDDVKLYVLSPNTHKLKKLADVWRKKLKELDKDLDVNNKFIDDAYEEYIKELKENLDKKDSSNVSLKVSKESSDINSIINETILEGEKDYSKTNGSSIAFILEHNNKKILFLGDAHEDIILDSIEKYFKNGEIPYFDLIKISHHGSLKNNFKWVEKVKSNKYVISTNGKKHNHPDKEVIAKILQCNNEDKTLYFNYTLKISDELNDQNLKNKYKYSIEIGTLENLLKIEI